MKMVANNLKHSCHQAFIEREYEVRIMIIWRTSHDEYCFIVYVFAEVIYEEKSEKLTDFGPVKAAHAHVEHVVIFLGPGSLVVK